MRSFGRLIVDFFLLESNYKALKEICPDNEVIFMVKANAYGHGLDPIVSFAHEELGIKEFGCATLEEAVGLRNRLKGNFDIIVFSETCLGREKYAPWYGNHRLIPLVSSMEGLDFFLENHDFRHVPFFLKFNVGMNRLGIDHLQVETTAAKIKSSGRRSIDHVMGHYSCSFLSIKEHPINRESQDNFKKVKSTLRAMGLKVEKSSIANSGAIEQGEGLEESHVRPGLMLYGPSGLGREMPGKWKGKMISLLETEILQTVSVERGTPVGYGATPCPDKGVIAIIGLGYGDGFSTRYEGVELEHRGHRGKILGRVSMDMAQVFFEEGACLEVGEPVQIWNHEVESFDRISKQTRTHYYELLCQLSTRLPRTYRSGA